MLFKLLRIRKTVKEVRADAGGFVGEEVAGLLKGLLIIPVVLVLLALGLFFVLGFTTHLGGPMGFFKVLFVIGAFVTTTTFLVIYPIIRFVRRSTARVVKSGIKTVRNEFNQ